MFSPTRIGCFSLISEEMGKNLIFRLFAPKRKVKIVESVDSAGGEINRIKRQRNQQSGDDRRHQGAGKACDCIRVRLLESHRSHQHFKRNFQQKFQKNVDGSDERCAQKNPLPIFPDKKERISIAPFRQTKMPKQTMRNSELLNFRPNTSKDSP